MTAPIPHTPNIPTRHTPISHAQLAARARRAPVAALALAAMVLAACSDDGGVEVLDRTGDSTVTTDGTGDGTSTTDVTGTTTPGFDPGPLDWGPCDDEQAEGDPTLQCATMTVPLDYAAPEGDTIDIALVRAPATDNREGAVLFNPGGPGGSGFDPIAASGSYIQEALGLGNFDIVGFDPRGVDRSGGIQCVDDAYMDAHVYLDDTPDTPAEQELYDNADSSFDEACLDVYGDTLRHYSTEFTARDMDAIRVGLGDEQISYLGISYGTYLGGVYATLFPEQVRAMVLDSAYEPNGDTVEQQLLTQLVGFEGAFDEWIEWCTTEDTCEFQAADVGARWDDLREQLDAKPLTADDGREINQSTLDTATQAALYSRSEWPVLAAALAAAEAGDGSQILALGDEYNGRNADGSYDSLFQSFDIIRCASGITTQAPDDPEALLAKIRDEAPRFGGFVTLEDLIPDEGEEDDFDGCRALTGEVEPAALDYRGDAPILVVGGTNDPATPFRWAEEMTAAMGPNARLLTYTGEGHGQLLTSTCVTEAEAATLAYRELPAEGAVCDPDPVIERPQWFDDLPQPEGLSGVVDIPAVTAAIGLPDTEGYAETHTTELTPAVIFDLLEDELIAAGFISYGTQDIGIPDTIDALYMTPDGDPLVVLILGPASFDSDDLNSARAAVPAGTSVVVFAYVLL